MRTNWFEEARFGIFIHFGIYSGIGRGEWVMSDEEIPKAEYEKAEKRFKASHFDAVKWASIIKQSGAKYAVLTAKHHDGYALFDSKSEYNSVKGSPGRNFIREYCDALRAEGIRVGLYYSLLDWHHPDFPAKGDPFHPERNRVKVENCDIDNFREFLKMQLRELLTDYGKIDLLWFDFSYPGRGSEFWDGEGLIELARELQPDIVLNSRLEASGEDFGTFLKKEKKKTAGDFINPEMIIPPDLIKNEAGEPVPWEACFTMDNHWGFCHEDDERKSSDMLIKKLVECVSRSGNMILNVSPDGDGRIPEWQEKTLIEIGEWLKKNGESIYGCSSAELPKPDWGRYTLGDGKIYAHLMEEPIGPIALPGLDGKISKARCLANGSELIIEKPWSAKAFKGYEFINWQRPVLSTYRRLVPPDTVIELSLK